MATLDSPEQIETRIRRAAILFAGGPAPAANAVISTAAVSFLKNGIEVIGILNGYLRLADYTAENTLIEGEHYIHVTHKTLKRTRNTQGVLLGTARTNPGKEVHAPEHLADAERSAPLKQVYEALRSLGVDALVSIGGDDTLKTANKFRRFQDFLPEGSPRIPVVHLPKTIDNDYMGIDFTFGYFTAVDTLASEIRNLLADAEANSSYFLTETMGRSAGWLAYGAAIAGEASLVISIEDITESFLEKEQAKDPKSGEEIERDVMNMDKVVDRIVRSMLAREQVEGKHYGVIVMAEGLAELLPEHYVAGVSRDDHGHISISEINLSRIFAKAVAEEYARQTNRERRVTGIQLGYETRCASPHAFDVMLGSQLGVGAYRALVENQMDGVMVSVSGQLELNYVPFDSLVDPETLVTNVRYIDRESDFHKLARFLETYVND
ncbi:MAG: 6-phosphofructokinase [Pirellulales bacterium]|nr:6-phosphofructokinase [Pirellulales bacterium]